MSCLHTLSSPPSPLTLQRLVSSLQGDDAILLLADGVYWLETLHRAQLPNPLYVIGADAAARGMAVSHGSIDYPAMVDLVVEHSKHISWG